MTFPVSSGNTNYVLVDGVNGASGILQLNYSLATTTILTIVLLGRVITRLGTLDDVHAGILENMFASDVAFLQDLYRRINQEGHTRAAVSCPACHHDFTVDMAGGRLGGS